MKWTKFTISILIATALFLGLLSCSDNPTLTPSFDAAQELPEGIKSGTPLGDARKDLFDDLGVVTYVNPQTTRFRKDLVSDQETINLGDASPPDSSAAILAIEMARGLYEDLPEDKKNLMPRNLYFMKDPTQSGSGFFSVVYESYLWTNSTNDVTIGSLNAAKLDTTQLKASYYYGLASILRNISRNPTFFTQFQNAVDEANEEGKYYFYVRDQASAYENGFVSSNQSKIRGDRLDFDTYASWAVMVEPEVREEVLNQYSIVNQKYQIVRSMFQQEGISLEEINQEWQESPLNPDNN